MKNIVVTIDFNGKEELLIEKGFQLALAFNCKLWIMHIAAPDPIFVGYSVGPQEVRDDRAADLRKAHRLLQEYSSNINERGVECTSLLVDGATITTILEEAKKLDADLIITGHESHGFIYRAVYGSTAEQLLEASEIPLLIIPFGEL